MHFIHCLAFLIVTHLVSALQPALNTTLFLLRSANLPRELPLTSGWAAQMMDCLYWQLVDEWAIPFAKPTDKMDVKADGLDGEPRGALAALCAMLAYLASPAGRRTRLHAPLEIRFGAPDALPLSPTFLSDPAALLLWIEPIAYRPLNLPTPARFRMSFEAFEAICAAHGGRPHLTKAHAPREVEKHEERARVRQWRKVRDPSEPEGMWWNAWLERHWRFEVEAGADGLEKEGILSKDSL
jgi:hypothetical protein